MKDVTTVRYLKRLPVDKRYARNITLFLETRKRIRKMLQFLS